jgi:murein DD-endopeptidase MepM/ murein hydrolase activator NlpD
MRARLGIAFTIGLLLAASPQGAAADVRPTPREGATLAVPLFGTLVRAWNAPEDDPFAAGHRGVDVAAALDEPVRASADGIVSFAGNVAGNRSVTVDHAGGIQTTYSFLASVAVKKGAHVLLGDVVGAVGRGHPNEQLPPHVHLSVRRNGTYVDPIGFYVGTSNADLVSLVA